MLKMIVTIVSLSSIAHISFATAPESWETPHADLSLSQSILYLPIADQRVKSVPVDLIEEEIVDLLTINHPRIRPLSSIDPQYQNSYPEYSQIRKGVFKKLMEMLAFLPPHMGIAYFEGLRPLWKQKEYFDKKFKEILMIIPDKNKAYEETTKHVSPFIDNIPTHGTGAAIDITLFEKRDDGREKLIDMGMFDTIHGHNPQQETFSRNTTLQQRENRLILLSAAAKAGLVNYGFEWWHYSYGDKAWAYVKNQNARYGFVGNKNDPLLSMDKQAYLNSVHD